VGYRRAPPLARSPPQPARRTEEPAAEGAAQRVYDLSEPLGQSDAFDASAARRAMEGKVLAQGRLFGTYRRRILGRIT
jgi:hypothetical protein